MKVTDLDRIDKAIIAALVADGRISNAQLAEQVGLSAGPCWQRVRRLEQTGIISGYSAVIDSSRLGVGEIVIIEVVLDGHDDEVLEAFGQAMAAMPEVMEVYLTTGEYDYRIKVPRRRAHQNRQRPPQQPDRRSTAMGPHPGARAQGRGLRTAL